MTASPQPPRRRSARGGASRVSLRRNAIAPQWQRIPKGAVALMTLGLNDAAIPVQAMRKDIETVIEGR